MEICQDVKTDTNTHAWHVPIPGGALSGKMKNDDACGFSPADGKTPSTMHLQPGNRGVGKRDAYEM